jgi:hypothetical protein
MHNVGAHGMLVQSMVIRSYEHGPKVPVTPEYIVLQRVLRKRKCMSILTKNWNNMHLISNGRLPKDTYNGRLPKDTIYISNLLQECQPLLAALFQRPPSYVVKVL